APNVQGQYVVVITDDTPPQPALTLADIFSGNLGLGRTPSPYHVVKELYEDNNATPVASAVTPVPAQLVVTHIDIPPQNYSGEKMLLHYTVTNQGSQPVWAGTQYWRDFLWLGQDPTFIRGRASYLGEVAESPGHPLQPGESYDVYVNVTLPAGTSGPYYLY